MSNETIIKTNEIIEPVDFCSKVTFEVKKDIVKKLIKGDFEKMHGMSFTEFISIYTYMLKNMPETFI